MKTIAIDSAVIAAARALDPVQEVVGAQNRGYFIDVINTYVGSPLGSPWCAGFVYYVGHHMLGDLWPLPKSGSCDVVLAAARKLEIVGAMPIAGAVFLRINALDQSDAQHTGFVSEVLPDGRWRTIEGNGALDGSREGTAVVQITRGGPSDPKRYLFVDWMAAV